MKRIITALFLGIIFLSPDSANAQCDLTPGSTLLGPVEQAMMVMWLPEDLRHSSTLLYRRTTDGTTAADFHSAVDGNSHTLVVISTTDGFVFGGYNEGTWEGPTSGYYEGFNPDNFLFSINSARKWPIRPDRLEYGTYNRDTYGPTFGGGHDLFLNSEMTGGYCYAWSYAPEGEAFEGQNLEFAGSYNSWIVAEIEVWALSDTGADLFCDTDGDGLADTDEVFIYGTDPADPDSDDDGLNDFDEIITHGTNPNDKDSDGDGLTDYVELTHTLTSPLNVDSDGDGCDDLMFATYQCEGQVLPECRADMNEDGTVNGLDLLDFLGQYGLDCPD